MDCGYKLPRPWVIDLKKLVFLFVTIETNSRQLIKLIMKYLVGVLNLFLMLVGSENRFVYYFGSCKDCLILKFYSTIAGLFHTKTKISRHSTFLAESGAQPCNARSIAQMTRALCMGLHLAIGPVVLPTYVCTYIVIHVSVLRSKQAL